MKLFRSVVVFSFFFLFGSEAVFSCDLFFSSLDNVFVDIDDPDNPLANDISTNSSVLVRNRDVDSCSFFVTFSKGSNNDPNYIRKGFKFSDTSILYQLYSSTNIQSSDILKEVVDVSSSSNVLSGPGQINLPKHTILNKKTIINLTRNAGRQMP